MIFSRILAIQVYSRMNYQRKRFISVPVYVTTRRLWWNQLPHIDYFFNKLERKIRNRIFSQNHQSYKYISSYLLDMKF